jgi:hypothetical protein
MHSLLVTWTLPPIQELHLHSVLTHFVHLRLLPSWELRCLLAVVSPNMVVCISIGYFTLSAM